MILVAAGAGSAGVALLFPVPIPGRLPTSDELVPLPRLTLLHLCLPLSGPESRPSALEDAWNEKWKQDRSSSHHSQIYKKLP